MYYAFAAYLHTYFLHGTPSTSSAASYDIVLFPKVDDSTFLSTLIMNANDVCEVPPYPKYGAQPSRVSVPTTYNTFVDL